MAPHQTDQTGRCVPVPPLRFTVAVAAACLTAAWLLPGVPPGLNLPLTGLAVAAAVALARPRTPAPDAAVFGVLALALVSMAAVRAAGWVVALDLALAAPLALVAVTGGSTWAEIAETALRPFRLVHHSPRFLLAPLAGRARAFPRAARPAIRGAALSAVLLGVFGTLFLTGDAAFAHLASRLVPSLDVDVALVAARFLTAAVTAAGASTLALTGPRYRAAYPLRRLIDDPFGRRSAGGEPAPGGFGRAEWAPALVALDLLFLAFVAVQLTVLFGGHSDVLERAGLTYAEYARQGFFQLLAAGALTLGVIAGSARWARRSTQADQRLLLALLGVLAALTFVVLASALRRLDLYEDAYGFTRARIAAHATVLWIGSMLGLVVTLGAAGRAGWLPRAALAVTGAALLVFNLANPDALVAERNARRFAATGRIDAPYLASLSADATPALARLPRDVSAPILAPATAALATPDPWQSLNVAREQARATLREAGLLH